ncbi:MAG: anti-sigma factor [Gammaproteobacteria bacterium]
MDCSQTRTLIQGYLDDELDIAHAAQIGGHLQGCPACQRLYAGHHALRSALRGQADYYPAPQDLRANLRALIRKTHKPAIRWTLSLNAASLGAAFGLVAALTCGLTLYVAGPGASEQLTHEIIANHVRSLMVDHLTDVVSSDRHTVKPWFNGRLDFSPPVSDLAAQGFTLVGGRLDYLDKQPVAALVYRHRQHLINLFLRPAGASPGAAEVASNQGYQVIYRIQDGMAYWAVSDLNRAELDEFLRIVLAQPRA